MCNSIFKKANFCKAVVFILLVFLIPVSSSFFTGCSLKKHYKIYTVEDLLSIENKLDSGSTAYYKSDITVELMNDIDLQWAEINCVFETLDFNFEGGGHSISNFVIVPYNTNYNSENDALGFCAVLDGGTIHNLNIRNMVVTTDGGEFSGRIENVGGLVGVLAVNSKYNNSIRACSLIDCYVIAPNSDNVGGYVGFFKDGSMEKCSFINYSKNVVGQYKGNVVGNANGKTGGLIGICGDYDELEQKVKVMDCITNAKIETADYIQDQNVWCGGFFGCYGSKYTIINFKNCIDATKLLQNKHYPEYHWGYLFWGDVTNCIINENVFYEDIKDNENFKSWEWEIYGYPLPTNPY